MESVESLTPRTTTDVVFDYLHAQILSLDLMPGTRISEADIADKLGVSRQPVRDAFNRLGNLRLLKVRPQRATLVSGFSIAEIDNARFVRLAVELAVARSACRIWDAKSVKALESNLDNQRFALREDNIDLFHRLDYDFHKVICVLGGHPLAFDTIVNCKQQVDRLCVLSLARVEEARAVLTDHEEIAQALKNGSADEVEQIVRRHLGRLDGTIADIYDEHSEYFE